MCQNQLKMNNICDRSNKSIGMAHRTAQRSWTREFVPALYHFKSNNACRSGEAVINDILIYAHYFYIRMLTSK